MKNISLGEKHRYVSKNCQNVKTDFIFEKIVKIFKKNCEKCSNKFQKSRLKNCENRENLKFVNILHRRSLDILWILLINFFKGKYHLDPLRFALITPGTPLVSITTLRPHKVWSTYQVTPSVNSQLKEWRTDINRYKRHP